MTAQPKSCSVESCLGCASFQSPELRKALEDLIAAHKKEVEIPTLLLGYEGADVNLSSFDAVFQKLEGSVTTYSAAVMKVYELARRCKGTACSCHDQFFKELQTMMREIDDAK
jgi:hypothetical protein